MDYKDIILRLKRTNLKLTEAVSIKRELRELPLSKRIEIVARLEEEKYKSDNSDINDVIDDIINEFKPKR
ncbi:hypothetical protein [Maribacter sp. 4G9]|jgi:hypothetical protein|uniref:hypothetical protein n=1 Tax=Maribacter sp. 4G9 TaxID=1889777 RepID=UPI000C146972|nr:hypothetical protein [Maribacter sp. 4G9]PIB39084.1 hypothetical protein BFP75_00990 [Maribacter sp. 4G9]